MTSPLCVQFMHILKTEHKTSLTVTQADTTARSEHCPHTRCPSTRPVTAMRYGGMQTRRKAMRQQDGKRNRYVMMILKRDQTRHAVWDETDGT
jgi:hypothetical protein